MKRRQFLTLSGAAFLASTMPLAAREMVTIGGAAFGSYWRLTLADGAGAEAVAQQVAQTIARIDLIFSPYRADSEFGEINVSETRAILPLSPSAREVLADALDIAAASDGAFDPTVGPDVARFGFGPITRGKGAHFSDIVLEPDGMRKQRADLSIDLCGIAKGHALDRLTAMLDEAGVGDYLLDLGGELAARGRHPAGRGWQIAVDTPSEGQMPMLPMLLLENQAIATSSNRIQGFEIGGQWHGHIIDPATSAPALGQTVSVSVLSINGRHADGWATALAALSHERAIALAEATGLDTLFLLDDGDRLKPVTTGRFADHLLA